jgi:hypothetical protein
VRLQYDHHHIAKGDGGLSRVLGSVWTGRRPLFHGGDKVVPKLGAQATRVNRIADQPVQCSDDFCCLAVPIPSKSVGAAKVDSTVTLGVLGPKVVQKISEERFG